MKIDMDEIVDVVVDWNLNQGIIVILEQTTSQQHFINRQWSNLKV